ncbi:MAG: cytochrome c oxidase subunit I [Gaiellales bacterium]
MVIHAQPAPAAETAAPTGGSGNGLWSWISTVDHKRIGIMYLVTTFFFFLVGGVFALVLRLQLEHSNNTLISPEAYNRIMTMHGTTMIFLFVVPVMAGFGNYLVPLQIGARDMAFPRLNALSYWLLLFGGVVMYSGFVWGGTADSGWTSYPPLSVISPGHGQDLWIVGLHVVGISSLIGAINFICTIHHMRAPGMRLSRLPLFTWSIDVYSIMIVAAGPVLAGALTMLLLDRNYGTNFYNPRHDGNVLLYQHLFWFYSHPVVYVMALPGFGMISEILPVFSRKPLFGYRALVYSLVAIAFLGFLVWGHHMFAVGFSEPLQIWFMLASMSIAVPTGVKIFNWIGTMWMGHLRFEPPMLFAVGFIGLFMIGGLSGIMLAIYPWDQYVTDSYFVVAHFHYVLGTVPVFAVMGGLHYWFPKMTGRMLDRSLGIWSFWLMFVGFNLTFFPMHAMGLSGMRRRIATYGDSSWTTYNQIATLGSFILAIGVLIVLWNVLSSLRAGRIAPNDPWGGNSLEWYTTSPPPAHNFDDLPPIRSERPMYDLRKETARQRAAQAAGAAPT